MSADRYDKLMAEVEALRAEVRSLVARLEAAALPGAAGPLTSWLDVARAVGVDDSTIRAHRRRTKNGTQPFFASADDARRWYAALVAAPDYTPAPRRSKRKPKDTDGPVDWSKTKV